jgi:hypothetical protein
VALVVHHPVLLLAQPEQPFTGRRTERRVNLLPHARRGGRGGAERLRQLGGQRIAVQVGVADQTGVGVDGGHQLGGAEHHRIGVLHQGEGGMCGPLGGDGQGLPRRYRAGGNVGDLQDPIGADVDLLGAATGQMHHDALVGLLHHTGQRCRRCQRRCSRERGADHRQHGADVADRGPRNHGCPPEILINRGSTRSPDRGGAMLISPPSSQAFPDWAGCRLRCEVGMRAAAWPRCSSVLDLSQGV